MGPLHLESSLHTCLHYIQNAMPVTRVERWPAPAIGRVRPAAHPQAKTAQYYVLHEWQLDRGFSGPLKHEIRVYPTIYHRLI